MFTKNKLGNSAMALTSTFLIAVLTGCGGGGGGSTPPDTGGEQLSFSPDPERLLTEASDSTALYVSEEFKFTSIQNVHLTLNAYDINGLALQNKKVHIYALEEEYETVESVGDQRQLIAIGSTNILGSFESTLETVPNTKQLLVTIDALGIENVKLADVNDTISLLFSGS